MKPKKKNDNPRKATRKRNSIQPAVPDNKRGVDNRKYGEGFRGTGEKVLRHEGAKEDEGTAEGLSDPLESPVGSKSWPPVPPPALHEAYDLIEAATAFWGLPSDSIVGTCKRQDICWPRFVCCYLLRNKGMSLKAIGRVLNRDHGAVSNGIKQFELLTELYPAYKLQAKEFDRFCFKMISQKQKNYKLGSVIT